MIAARMAVPLGLAIASAVAALTLAPRAFEAQSLLAIQDDPAALADRAVAQSFNADVAASEITAALASDDADLAGSFLELAQDAQVGVDAELVDKVKKAKADAASTARSMESFARGFVTGEPADLAGLAGTAVGDLFVFGDIRDAVREGSRLAMGEPADEMILGLACVGLAVTAGTYATLGIAAPARAGLTLVKAARATGRIGSRLAAWIGRSLRETVDWATLGRAFSGGGIAQPVLAVRAARDVVKAEKAQALVRLVGDVGRVQARAGTQAALDGLKVAQGPRDMSRIARLAASKGGKTRAILKLAGRAAIMLTLGTFNLALWVFWALLTVFGFVASLKRMVERATEHYCTRRKLRHARAREAQGNAERAAHLRTERPAPRVTGPVLVYSSAPAVVPQRQPIFSLAQLPARPASWPGLPRPSGSDAEAAIERLDQAVHSLKRACA
jgi:hypothetical protein